MSKRTPCNIHFYKSNTKKREMQQTKPKNGKGMSQTKAHKQKPTNKSQARPEIFKSGQRRHSHPFTNEGIPAKNHIPVSYVLCTSFPIRQNRNDKP